MDSALHVTRGGPPAMWTTTAGGTAVEVRKLTVGEMDNDVYLLTDAGTREALLIDAADEADRILGELGDRTLRAILTTHGHGDHWQALAAVAEATGAPTYLHPADAAMVPVSADVVVQDGDRIAVGGFTVELLHTPGHTPGSVSALLGDTDLFTGDTLFPGGPGGTWGDTDAFAQVMRSLRTRLFAYDDTVRVHPGHGDSTTLGAQRPSLDEWEARGW